MTEGVVRAWSDKPPHRWLACRSALCRSCSRLHAACALQNPHALGGGSHPRGRPGTPRPLTDLEDASPASLLDTLRSIVGAPTY